MSESTNSLASTGVNQEECAKCPDIDLKETDRINSDPYAAEVSKYLEESHSSASNRIHYLWDWKDLINDVMVSVYLRKAILFCVDVEGGPQSDVTEIGVAIYDPRGQEMALSPHIKSYHIVIEENIQGKYDRYVPVEGKYITSEGHNFNGVLSYMLTQYEAISLMNHLIEEYFQVPMPCMIVGHSVRGDIRWLNELGVQMPYGAPVLDTQEMYALTRGKDGSSLKNALLDIGQPYAYLHNAGNDSFYTLLLAMKLCDPLVRRLTRFDCIDSFRAKIINARLLPNFSLAIHVSVEEILRDVAWKHAI